MDLRRRARSAALRGAAPRERTRARRPRQGRARVTVKEKEDDTSEIFLSKLREAKRRIRKKTGGRVQTPACEGVDRSRAMVPFSHLEPSVLGCVDARAHEIRRRSLPEDGRRGGVYGRGLQGCARDGPAAASKSTSSSDSSEPHDHALPVFVHGPGSHGQVLDRARRLHHPESSLRVHLARRQHGHPEASPGRHPRGASAAPRGSPQEAHAMRSPRGSGVPSRQGPARRRTRGVPRDRRGDAAPRLEGHGSPPPGARALSELTGSPTTVCDTRVQIQSASRRRRTSPSPDVSCSPSLPSRSTHLPII